MGEGAIPIKTLANSANLFVAFIPSSEGFGVLREDFPERRRWESIYSQLPIIQDASVQDSRIRFRVLGYRKDTIFRGSVELEYENSQLSILESRIVSWGIKTTSKLSILEYRSRKIRFGLYRED